MGVPWRGKPWRREQATTQRRCRSIAWEVFENKWFFRTFSVSIKSCIDDEEQEAQKQQASSTSAPSTPRPSSSALLWASRALFAGAAVSGGVMLLNYLRRRMAADGTHRLRRR
jgi:hypothetical protein